MTSPQNRHYPLISLNPAREIWRARERKLHFVSRHRNSPTREEPPEGGTPNAPGRLWRGGIAGSPRNPDYGRGFETQPAGRRVFELYAFPFGVPRLRGSGEARGGPPKGGTPNRRNSERVERRTLSKRVTAGPKQPGAGRLMIGLFRLEFRVYAVRAEPAGDRLKAEFRTGATPNEWGAWNIEPYRSARLRGPSSRALVV